MKDYKVGEYVAVLQEEEYIGDGFVGVDEQIYYGKIIRIIGQTSQPTGDKRYECLDYDEGSNSDTPNTFSIRFDEVDDELTTRMDRERKLKELGL